jgi:hypothetical protein
MSANQGQKQSRQQGSTLEAGGTSSSRSKTSSSFGEVGDEMSGSLSQGASQVRDLAQEHAGTATLVALGAGLGIGLLIGIAMRSSQSRPRSWRERLIAEGIGRRLLERAEGMVPEALSERLGL